MLAVGGGSVIDAAKVIAGGVFYEGDPWDLVTNPEKIGVVLPIVTPRWFRYILSDETVGKFCEYGRNVRSITKPDAYKCANMAIDATEEMTAMESVLPLSHKRKSPSYWTGIFLLYFIILHISSSPAKTSTIGITASAAPNNAYSSPFKKCSHPSLA